MKKKLFILLLLWIMVFDKGQGFGEQISNEEELPPGMEIVYVGKTKAVVPKGSRVNREEGFVVLESTNEYVGRKFLETNQQIEEIKLWKTELEKKMYDLRDVVEKSEKQMDGLRLRKSNVYAEIAELSAKEQELKQEIDLLKKEIKNIKNGTW